MKLMALLAAVSTFVSIRSAQADLVINDGEFSDWTFNSTGTATVTREASGGNPGARLNITTVSGNTVWGTAIKSDFSSSAVLTGAKFTLSLEVAAH